MKKLASTKKEAFEQLLSAFHEVLSNAGCNDFEVANTPEMFQMLEEYGARNLRCASVETFRQHSEYEDYKPHVSEDGQRIWCMDFQILSAIEKELGLK